MRDIDVRAHEQRLTEKAANILDVFATEKRESAKRKYLGFAPRLVGGRTVRRTRRSPSGTPVHLTGTAVPPSCRAKRNM